MTAAGRPLRILAIPLAHLPSAGTNAPPLIYWHVSQRLPAASASSASSSSAASALSDPASPTTPTTPSTVLTRPALLAGLDYARPASWPDWATQKASATWLSLSDSPREGSLVKTWKYKTWRTGEHLMDKIACEEWALKNVQTRLDPWTGEVKRSGETVEEDAVGGQTLVVEPKRERPRGEKIQLIYPAALAPHDPLSLLSTHLSTRIPHHRTLLGRSLLLAPALLPIGIIPVLPNLPMFYVLWRAWSHWKAKLGGEYLRALVDAGDVRAVQSDALGRAMRRTEGEGEEKGQHARTAADERAPDQTTTPADALNAPAPASPQAHAAVQTAEAQKKLDEAVPSPEKVDEAPDATATPAGQVFRAAAAADTTASPVTSTPSTTSAPASSSFSASTTGSTTTDDDRISPQLLLQPRAISALARAFDLSAPEIVDITRAVEQAAIRLRAQAEQGRAKR